MNAEAKTPESKLRANAKYHKAHIASLACRVPIGTAEEFKRYCESQGKTVNGVLREYVLSCLGEVMPGEDGSEDDTAPAASALFDC